MGPLIELLNYVIDYALIRGGWVLFFMLLVWMLYFLRKQKNNKAYVESIKWVFLEVKIDEVNEKSPLAMEQIFASLHAIHTNFTWGEIFAGKTVLWLSCEIVSLGGKVSYIFKIPERYRNLLESAIFAQYPKAEVNEVEDYLKNLPHHYDPEHANFDFWGTQFNKKKDSAYPIRTFGQVDSFEHSAQETFIEPLSNLLEVMSNMQPHELLVWQIVIKPVNDDWKEHTAHLIDKLKGVPSHHEEPLWLKAIIAPFKLFGDALVSLITPPDEHKKEERVKEEPPTLMLHKTDVEKLVINSIQRALSKIGYEVRIRALYLAPKDKINKSLRIPEFIGAVRNFDDVNLNGLKPDIGHSWTEGPTYRLSERLERPYLERAKLTRKRHMLHNFLARSHWRGVGKFVMNTEELATIFHFPQTQHARISQLEKVHTVKSAPPMDLPIG
ncbi:MAG: hypothetical protein KW802_00415 [Candidatus Doudnabacteria bacterium]|nr:hypothetical protein [Candidatus Doudnabacteria bacterium]